MFARLLRSTTKWHRTQKSKMIGYDNKYKRATSGFMGFANILLPH